VIYVLYIFLNLTASDRKTVTDSKNVVERDLIADQHVDLYRRKDLCYGLPLRIPPLMVGINVWDVLSNSNDWMVMG